LLGLRFLKVLKELKCFLNIDKPGCFLSLLRKGPEYRKPNTERHRHGEHLAVLLYDTLPPLTHVVTYAQSFS